MQAFWDTQKTGVIFLSRDWRAKELRPPIKLKIGTLKRLYPLSARYFGERSGYYRLRDKLCFLLHLNNYPNLDLAGRKIYVCGDFNDWKVDLNAEGWQLKQENNTDWSLEVPWDSLVRKRSHSFKFFLDNGYWIEPPNDAPNAVPNEHGSLNFQLLSYKTGAHIFGFEIEETRPICDPNWVLWEKDPQEAIPIDYRRWLLNAGTQKPLGAIVEDNKTTFRLFAPRAQKVWVSLSKTLTNAPELLPLYPSEEGIWETTYPQNLHLSYYHYQVEGDNKDPFTHFDKQVRLLDPYALVTVDKDGPGIIWDLQQSPPIRDTYQSPQWHDLVIMECHIRDLLAKAPMELSQKERQGFSGLTRWLQEDTCYLRQLGINAVELQPVQEFDNASADEYHWGYMPVNYFAPEGSYALEPRHGSQVKEFQQLVNAFHNADIAVILDVAYNHVGEPNPLLFIDKYYYFETTHEGHLTNWSGCGNDFRATTPMGKRLIIDSLKHWLLHYNVDGFRFDLAELLGIATLQEIERELKKVKPSVILIAEPWSFRGHIGYALKKTGFMSWNDGYRDFMAKYVLGEGNSEGIRYFLSGSMDYLSRFPAQSVNYTESHDDRCWLDKITENEGHNGFWPTQNDRRRTHLMFALLMMSIGIPMLAEGQELLRSKQGTNNTYKRGDLNALDYERAYLYPSTFDYLRQWITFRLSNYGKVLRLADPPSKNFLKFFFAPGSSAVCALYNADACLPFAPLLFAINPHGNPITFKLENIASHAFTQIADVERFQVNGLPQPTLPWLSDDSLTLPAFSCSLWRTS